MRLRASLHWVFSTLMCFLNERCESHHSPRNFVDSSTGSSVFPILTMGGLWARHLGAVKCTTLQLWAANLKPFLVAHSCMAFTACCRCLSMVCRERPWKQIARSSTKSALKMSLAIQEGGSFIFNPKHITASVESVVQILTRIRRSLRYSETKTGSLPLRPILWRSRMMPYCQVVSYAFSKSKKRPTACCLWAKASRRYLSRLTRCSVVLRCFRKPHWLLSSILYFSRYQMRRVLIMRSKLCIDSWLVQWVGNWVDQYGLYLVWGLGSPLLLSTVEENL